MNQTFSHPDTKASNTDGLHSEAARELYIAHLDRLCQENSELRRQLNLLKRGEHQELLSLAPAPAPIGDQEQNKTIHPAC